MEGVELRFPARAEHLALVRLVIGSLAETHRLLDDRRLEDLRLAVSEACANAIEAYGRRGIDGGPVTVRCEAGPDSIVVEVSDEAGGFDPDGLVPHPPVTKPERLHYERGLGIPLMRTVTDEAEFRRENGGMTVRLVVRRRARSTRKRAVR